MAERTGSRSLTAARTLGAIALLLIGGIHYQQYRYAFYSAVPTIHHLLLSRARDERPAGSEGLRFIRSCSAALPPEMMAKMEQAFGAPVLEAYGMTEASHQMSSNPEPPAPRKPATGTSHKARPGSPCPPKSWSSATGTRSTTR